MRRVKENGKMSGFCHSNWHATEIQKQTTSFSVERDIPWCRIIQENVSALFTSDNKEDMIMEIE